MQNQTKSYRDRGEIGAILDIYEDSIENLTTLLWSVSQEELSTIVDKETNDEDCRSINTILQHVVKAGHTYAVLLRNNQGEKLDFPDPQYRDTVDEYIDDLRSMFQYNVQVFEEHPDINMHERVAKKKIKAPWGTVYDGEELYEHAIVHILRHHRQIERFLIKLRA